MKASRIALAVFVIFTIACFGREPQQSERVTTTQDSAGVEFVVSEGPDLLLEIDEVLRVGTVDGPVSLQFNQVVDVAIDSLSHIWVADADERVRQYDAEGRFIDGIGGRGDGPGEDPEGFYEVHPMGGSILLYGGRQSLQILTRAGDFVASRSSFLDGSRFFDILGGGDGRWLFLRSEAPNTDQDRARGSWEVFEASVPGDDLASVVALPGPPYARTTRGTWSGGSFFDGLPSIDVGPDGMVYYSDPTEYRVTVFESGGGLVRVLERRVAKKEIGGSLGSDLRAEAEAAMEEIAPRSPSSDREIDQLARASAPSSGTSWMPVLDKILVSLDGSVWVRRADQHRSPAARAIAAAFGYVERAWIQRWRSEQYWDLFEPAGAYQGTIILPAGFVPMAVTSDRIYGVERDELDVEYVVAYEGG